MAEVKLRPLPLKAKAKVKAFVMHFAIEVNVTRMIARIATRPAPHQPKGVVREVGVNPLRERVEDAVILLKVKAKAKAENDLLAMVIKFAGIS